MKESNFIVGISRHAPKGKRVKGEDATQQLVDREAAERGAEEVARRLIDRLETAPSGAIMALEPSNVKRAEETRDMEVEHIKKILHGRTDIEILELGEVKTKTDDIEHAAVISKAVLDKIKGSPDKKFIIANLRKTGLLGFRADEESTKTVIRLKDKLGDDESVVGKIWGAHISELDNLRTEMQGLGIDVPENLRPQEFETTPEETVLRQLRWVLGMKKIGEHHLANRTIMLEGVSHNLRADFTALALLGEDISLESINRVMGGKFREPFERSEIIFSNKGTSEEVTVDFRGIQRTYSKAEFNQLIKDIRRRAQERKREWADTSLAQG